MTIKELFELQHMLNMKLNFDDAYLAEALATDASDDDLIVAGEWLDDFIKAMSSEIEELRNCTYWKHWCSEAQEGQRYKVRDLDAARKEVIDILHFWINLAQALGMTPEMVSKMYRKKLKKNIHRQNTGYSVETKALAWKLYCGSRKKPYTAKSLEELPEVMQTFYLDWARDCERGEKEAK